MIRDETKTRSPARGGPFTLHEKIDVCRGVFAVLVVMAHSLEIAWGVHPGAQDGLKGWAGAVAAGVFGTGTYYVMGFFVLSGYCIHLSVARSAGEGRRFPAGRYFLARLSRILPLYYLGLLATLAVEWVIAGARPHEWPNGLDAPTFVAQILLVQNLTETFGSFASSWSITNEVFYYVFYGALACLFLGGRSGASGPAWVGLGICAAVAAVTQGLYVTVGRNPYVYSAGMLMGLGMLWFIGALVASEGQRWLEIGWVRASARFWPLALAVAIAWKTCHLPPHGVYLISGAAFTLMILNFIARSPAVPRAEPGPLRAGVVNALGLSSYPMYLFHGPLLMLLGSGFLRSGWVTDWRATWAVLFGVGVASGVFLGWVLERPVMAWRAAMLRRFGTGSGSRGVTARPAAAASRPSPVGAGVHS